MNSFNNLSDHIQSVVVKEPAGILTPGVIIIGKTKLSPEVVTNNEYYPSKVWESYSPAPGEDIPEEASLPSIDNYQVGDKVKVENDYYILNNYPYPVFYQYKVSNDKFIGFIGDLAEYGFKHIPEKFYYNNISPLDLLNEDSQYTIGSRFPVLKAVSDHAVFTEICKEDYSNPNSLLESTYDKFRPHYFGTAIQGDRTVLMFIVPPGYNKVSIAGETEIYSRKDYFAYYGPSNQFYDSYVAYMEAAQSHFLHATRPGSTPYGQTTDVNFHTNPILDYSDIVTEPRQLVVDYDTAVGLVDNNPDDIDPGGRGKNGGQNYNGSTTVVSLVDGYSLIYNDHTGTELVVPNDAYSAVEYYDTDTDTGLYDYWKPDSPYTFETLTSFDFYIKTSPKNSRFSYTSLAGVNLQSAIEDNMSTLEKEYVLEETASVASGDSNLVDLSGLTSSISLKIDDSGYYYKFDEELLMLRLTRSTSKLNYYIYNKAGEDLERIWSLILKIGDRYYKFKEARYYFYILRHSSSNSYTFKKVSEIDKWTEKVKTETNGIYKKFASKHTKYFGSIYYDISNDSYSTIPPEVRSKLNNAVNIIPDHGWYWKQLTNYQSIGGEKELDSLINTFPYFSGYSGYVKCNNKYYEVAVEDADKFCIKDYSNSPSSGSGGYNPYGYVTPINVDVTDKSEGLWDLEPTDWTDKEKNYYQYINGETGGKSSLEINLKSDYEDYYRLVKIVISPKEVKECRWEATAETAGAKEVDELPLLPNSEYKVGDIVRISNGGSFQFYALTYVGSETVKSINIVNLGYRTSDNPLKNLDKYLIREEGYIPKYSKTKLGVVDLTSGTYISKDFRENTEEDTVSGKKFSYRKTYRKGQAALVGIPDGLNDKIVDIKQIVQSSEDDEDNMELGSTVYDYSRGTVYRYRAFEWKELTDLEEEPFYIKEVDALPESIDSYKEGDIVKIRNNYEFYILTESNNENGLIKQEFFDENYLFRYRGEYFLWRENQTGYLEPYNSSSNIFGTVYCDGLVRGNILGIRTWISTCDNNTKNLPWASRSWMSNDGELSVGDKVWIIITSGNSKQKLLGTIKKREKGTCLEIKSKIPMGGTSREVKLNGAVMKVGVRYDGQTKERFTSLYQKRRLHLGQEELADITKDLVFRNKINYVTVFDYEN